MRSDFVIKSPLASMHRQEPKGQEREQGTQARDDGGPNQVVTVEMMVRNGQDHDRLGDKTDRT